MKKIVIVVVALVLLVAGGIWTRNYIRKCADKKGAECLQTYYKLAGDGYPSTAEKTKIAAVLVEMEKASRHCSPNLADVLFARRLDGAFLVGDYDKAQALMDEYKDKSDSWKSGAKAKIRAHAALEKGDKATAIAEFLSFLDTILKEKETEPEMDPYTGVEWTKEMIVAHNYKRLGELSADIGRRDDADRYRAEAKKSYQAALERAKDDPEMKAAIEKDAGVLLK